MAFPFSRRGWLAWGGVAALSFAAWHIDAPKAADQETAEKQVQLTVDYGDGVQKRFTAIKWREQMTVLDALSAAQKHPRGIKFTYRGKGSTAFLTKIDDLENEGAGKNWIYRVNDKLADRSFAVQTLKPSDKVLWKFQKFR